MTRQVENSFENHFQEDLVDKRLRAASKAVIRGKLWSKLADQPARQFQPLFRSPSGFFFPTPFPACTKTTKDTEVEGYKLPSLLVLGAQTFRERSPLSPSVLSKPPILQGLRGPLGSSIGTQSRFPNTWLPALETQPRWPIVATSLQFVAPVGQ